MPSAEADSISSCTYPGLTPGLFMFRPAGCFMRRYKGRDLTKRPRTKGGEVISRAYGTCKIPVVTRRRGAGLLAVARSARLAPRAKRAGVPAAERASRISVVYKIGNSRLSCFCPDSLFFRNFVGFAALQVFVLFAAAAGPVDDNALDSVLFAYAEGDR